MKSFGLAILVSLPGVAAWAQSSCPAAAASTLVDAGLRASYGGAEPVVLALEPDPVSPLRLSKSGRAYGLALVPTGDAHASRIRVKLAGGVCALRVYSKASTRVFLSGSREYSDDTCEKYYGGSLCDKLKTDNLGEYMMYYTVGAKADPITGTSVKRFVDSHSVGEAKKRFDDFADLVAGWSSGAQVYQHGFTAGHTYIVDESGSVLGDLATGPLFTNGISGMTELGDAWGFDGYNKVMVGDGRLTYNGTEYDVVGFSSVSPIVLDLDGDGAPDVDRGEWLPHPQRFNRARSVLFDINGDGKPDLTEWVGPHDGLLVMPLAPGEPVRSGKQLFGNPGGYLDGYHKLGLLFDKDRDGYVKGAELEGLSVWRDADSNGRTEPSELKTVQELAITSIGVHHKDLRGSFTIGGRERSSWDWWPSVFFIRQVAKAKG